jgi:hypothetical protein
VRAAAAAADPAADGPNAGADAGADPEGTQGGHKAAIDNYIGTGQTQERTMLDGSDIHALLNKFKKQSGEGLALTMVDLWTLGKKFWG